MQIKSKLPVLFALVVVLGIASVIPGRAPAQANSAPSLITQPLDESKMLELRGNTHPLARAEFDRGIAPASLPMDHMQLVLKRSPQQETALENLLAQQQDRKSADYHKWLTPEQFGAEFGPSDQDIQTITLWLESQGFHIDEVSKGRTVVDFSGTAGQVQQAFRTAIHRYVLANGEEHWANSSDPEIPVALAGAVAGVNTLHNFSKNPMNHVLGRFSRSRDTGQVHQISPQFTFAGGCNNTQTTTGTNCFALGPQDFATIYNVTLLWNAGTNGTGQTIAIVSDSDIVTSDVTTFKSLFGLPANPPNIIHNGTAPGLQGNEVEAVLDVEWAGAVATGAAIDLVVSADTNAAFGGDLSAEYVINCQAAGTGCAAGAVPASILSYSYGLCELALGTSGNQFYNTEWQQAAAEGITVLVSTGDNGSAGCDSSSSNVSGAQPADFGLAVSGIASTPFNIAVGGTDFNDFALSTANTFWNSSNASGTQASAKGYIPEIAYNDTCTNSIIFGVFSFSTGEAACNNAAVENDGLVVPAGGSGGVSNCTSSSTTSTSTTLVVSSCSGGYAKPAWQIGLGVPSDGKRDIPDVSLFAGDGTIQNFYIVCEADQDAGGAACNLNSPFQDFLGVGGTSVSVQAFAGLMALIDQQQGRQGNANPVFYTLAAQQSASSCNTSGPASTCVFNDVTSGTNAMPCAKGSPNCTVANSSDTIGVLSGYTAGTGYDLVTGLGSVNAANLASKWGPNFYLTASNPAVTIASAGGSATLTVTATPVDGFTGMVNFSCSGLPSGVTCSSASLEITNANPQSVSITVTKAASSMPGPTWQRLRPNALNLGFGIALVLAMSTAIFLAGSVVRRLAMASLVFGVMLFAAACGGGSGSSSTSSNSSGGTSGTSTTTATVTGSSGSVSSPLTITVTEQ